MSMGRAVFLVTAPNRRMPVDAYFNQDKADEYCDALNKARDYEFSRCEGDPPYYTVVSIVAQE